MTSCFILLYRGNGKQHSGKHGCGIMPWLSKGPFFFEPLESNTKSFIIQVNAHNAPQRHLLGAAPNWI